MNKFLSKKSAIIFFTAPFLILYTLMMIYPICQTVIKSFYDWDGITKSVFVGLQNYREMLKDPDFWPAIKNGLIFAAVVFLFQQGMGTILALIFSTPTLELKGKNFLRRAFLFQLFYL